MNIRLATRFLAALAPTVLIGGVSTIAAGPALAADQPAPVDAPAVVVTRTDLDTGAVVSTTGADESAPVDVTALLASARCVRNGDLSVSLSPTPSGVTTYTFSGHATFTTDCAGHSSIGSISGAFSRLGAGWKALGVETDVRNPGTGVAHASALGDAGFGCVAKVCPLHGHPAVSVDVDGAGHVIVGHGNGFGPA